MNETDLPALLSAAGLGSQSAAITQFARPALRLSATPTDEAAIAVGTSKLGGMPDLPPNASWPEWKGIPQSFIAQIRLADLHALDAAHDLPAAGTLWFFYDAKGETYGADPADRGGWRVLFSANTPTLQRTAFPATLSAASCFTACALTPTAVTTLPQSAAEGETSTTFTADEQKRYEQFLTTWPTTAPSPTPRHQLLGYPLTLQDDMRGACEALAHGVATSDPRAASMLTHADRWRLLLQVDSDAAAGMHWGSAGMLYYWIERDALAAGRFENVWLMQQSD